MKLREIFRFEFAYQVRRVSTWLYFAVLVFFAFVQTTENFLADVRTRRRWGSSSRCVHSVSFLRKVL